MNAYRANASTNHYFRLKLAVRSKHKCALLLLLFVDRFGRRRCADRADDVARRRASIRFVAFRFGPCSRTNLAKND